MLSYSGALPMKTLKVSGTLQMSGRTKPQTTALEALCQGDQSNPSHTQAGKPGASHFQTCCQAAQKA